MISWKYWQHNISKEEPRNEHWAAIKQFITIRCNYISIQVPWADTTAALKQFITIYVVTVYQFVLYILRFSYENSLWENPVRNFFLANQRGKTIFSHVIKSVSSNHKAPSRRILFATALSRSCSQNNFSVLMLFVVLSQIFQELRRIFQLARMAEKSSSIVPLDKLIDKFIEEQK